MGISTTGTRWAPETEQHTKNNALVLDKELIKQNLEKKAFLKEKLNFFAILLICDKTLIVN